MSNINDTVTTITNMISANNYQDTLKVDLTNIQQVADSIKSAMSHDKLKSISDITAGTSPDELLKLVQKQSESISQTLIAMNGAAGIDQNLVQSTMNAALSTVLTTMNCSINNMHEGLSKIKSLSSQIESLKNSLKSGNIDELSKMVK